MSDDQRREPRFHTRKRLWCEGQDQTLLGEAHNASKGGMFIVANEDTEIGQHMRVCFKEGDQEVALKMEVMWKGKREADGQAGIGVRIVSIDKGQAAYERFLARHAPDRDELPIISEICLCDDDSEAITGEVEMCAGDGPSVPPNAKGSKANPSR